MLTAALLTTLVSAAICVVAVLTPAPAVALPFVVVTCIGCPMFATWEVPAAVASLRVERVRRHQARALATLRRALEHLPETEHPLGF